jgi:hypothetical protein
MSDYNLCIKRIDKWADAGSVLPAIRATYNQCKAVQALIVRFGTDQDFSDAFDTLMMSDGFDGTAMVSQMLYNINQLVTAWEANQNYKDVLGIP